MIVVYREDPLPPPPALRLPCIPTSHVHVLGEDVAGFLTVDHRTGKPLGKATRVVPSYWWSNTYLVPLTTQTPYKSFTTSIARWYERSATTYIPQKASYTDLAKKHSSLCHAQTRQSPTSSSSSMPLAYHQATRTREARAPICTG